MSSAKLHKKAFKENFKKPKGDAITLYKRLLQYGKPFWMAFVIAVFANICYAGIDSGFTYLLKPLLDHGFVDPDPSFIKIVPFIAIGLFVLRSIANLAGNYYMAWVGRNVVMQFRREIFQQLMRLPCSFYDKSSSGHLLSMIVYNSAQVASAVTDAITHAIQSSCLVLGLLVVMFSISWRLSLMFFITLPIIAVAMKMSSARLRRLNRTAQLTMGEITHTAEEAIEGYKVVRTFGGETEEIKKFNKVTLENMRRELKIVITKCVSVSSVQLAGVTGLALMIYFGTTAASQETLTAGGFTAVLAAMMALLKPMKDIASVNATIQRGLAGAESVFELIDADVEKDHGDIEVERVKGAIEFKQVGFSYTDECGAVLKDISFQVEPGQTVALVGRSGSGKSTLVSLLPRFYDLQQGQITIDSIDLFDIKLSCLRQQFAIVSQHVTLFNDSIANNIAYGKNGQAVSEAEIIEAATAAHAMEFIKDLPDGIHTLVGENGVLLSGGQRQRIAIARAILKDAPILILDEATSALDTESERLIQAALEAVMRNRTTLVIAHRLSTIENANQIIVLDQGNLMETGTHTELLAKRGHYAHLHDLQFKDPKAVAQLQDEFEAL